MKYQKSINLVDNGSNQPSKFRTKNWLKINDDSRGTYNTNSQIKFKVLILKSSLCHCSDACILVKRTIIVPNTAVAHAAVNDINKIVIFKNRPLFTDCISETNNTQVNNSKNIDVVMPMYIWIEYSDNYLKTSGSLWFRNEPTMDGNGGYC